MCFMSPSEWKRFTMCYHIRMVNILGGWEAYIVLSFLCVLVSRLRVYLAELRTENGYNLYANFTKKAFATILVRSGCNATTKAARNVWDTCSVSNSYNTVPSSALIIDFSKVFRSPFDLLKIIATIRYAWCRVASMIQEMASTCPKCPLLNRSSNTLASRSTSNLRMNIKFISFYCGEPNMHTVELLAPMLLLNMNWPHAVVVMNVFFEWRVVFIVFLWPFTLLFFWVSFAFLIVFFLELSALFDIIILIFA